MFTSGRLFRFLLLGWTIASLALVWFIVRADDYDRAIALNTLLLGTMAATVSLPLGFGLAWCSCGNRIYNRLILLAIVSLLAIPVFLHVSSWDAAIGRMGWIKNFNAETFQPLISGWTAAAWIHGVAAVPQVAIILLIGLSVSNSSVEEQALLDVSRWRVFWQIRIRRLLPLFLLSILWTIVATSREIAATDLYQIGTLAEQIYLGYSLGQFNAIVGGWSAEDLAAAADLNYLAGLVVLLWLATTSGLLCWTLVEKDRELEQMVSRRPFERDDVLDSAASIRLKQAVAGLLLILLLLTPLVNLAIRGCFHIDSVAGYPVPRYTVSHLAEVLYRSIGNYQREFGWTILIASSASLSIIFLATPLVWKARTSAGFRFLLGVSWVISCTLPGPLIGSLVGSLFSLSDSEWITFLYNRTIVPPVLATMIFCWPWPPLIIWFVFRKISREVIELARLDGAGERTIFWRFGILDQLPKLFGCWLVTFAICVGELSASQLVLPPGMDTLPRLMLGLLHAGVEDMTAGITIVLMALVGSISCLGWKFTRRNAKI